MSGKRLVLWLSLFCFACPSHWVIAQKAARDETKTLFGHVFDGKDQPLPKAIVYLKNTKTLAIRTYISDPDGAYRFPALSPNVDYEVFAKFPEWGVQSDTKTLSAFDSRKQITITLHIHEKQSQQSRAHP